MNELALFAGAGGGILGGKLLGWRTVCAVEWESYPASVLCARQNDGLLPPFPIWDDVQTFDGKPWAGIVDVVSGGFPCQDISIAGNGDGLDGERSGMWREMARIISEVRPRFAFVENSPMLVTRGLERVLADLTAMGYDSRWGVVSAADIGAKHKRERIWIVACSNTHKQYRWGKPQQPHNIGGKALHDEPSRVCPTESIKGNVANSNCNINIGTKSRSNGIQKKVQREPRTQNCSTWESSRTSNVFGGYSLQRHEETNYVGNTESAGFSSCFEGQGERESWRASIGSAQWWQIEPPVDRVVDGMADRVDRLKAIGNGQVPLCAATAWKILSEQR